MPDATLPLTQREKQAHSRSLWMRAYQCQMGGDLDDAISLYRKSIAVQPSAEAHTFLGWSYSFQGDLSAAIQECRKAIQVDPSFGNPYNDIGAYYIQQGKYKEAIPWLNKALKAERYEPRHFPHFNMGFALLNLGKPKDALRQFRLALEKCPEYQPAAQMIAHIESRYN